MHLDMSHNKQISYETQRRIPTATESMFSPFYRKSLSSIMSKSLRFLMSQTHPLCSCAQHPPTGHRCICPTMVYILVSSSPRYRATRGFEISTFDASRFRCFDGFLVSILLPQFKLQTELSAAPCLPLASQFRSSMPLPSDIALISTIV